MHYLSYLDRWFLGPQVTLQDCLSAFFSADELKGTSYSIVKTSNFHGRNMDIITRILLSLYSSHDPTDT